MASWPSFWPSFWHLKPLLGIVAMLELDQSFEELERAFERKYDIVAPKPLGKGAYGTVYQAFSKERQHVVAIKTMKLNRLSDGKVIDFMRLTVVESNYRMNPLSLSDSVA